MTLTPGAMHLLSLWIVKIVGLPGQFVFKMTAAKTFIYYVFHLSTLKCAALSWKISQEQLTVK